MKKRNPFIIKTALIAGLLLSLVDQAHAYIGPGAGFAVMGSFLAVFSAILAGMLAMVTWPIRYLVRTIRYRKAFKRSRIKRCVILGLDGMDPKVAEKLMDEGKLPTLAKLREEGTFSPLATTVPSMSPVAWSSFQTGTNPGKHNIYDFLTRDKQTYLPKLSSVDIRGPQRMLKLGALTLPIGKPAIRLLRKGKPFWITLGENGIFSSVLRVPITFPPEKFYGVSLSGMCVPDLRGSQGMFSLFTSEKRGFEPQKTQRGKAATKFRILNTSVFAKRLPKEAVSIANGNECRIPKELDHELRESTRIGSPLIRAICAIRDQKKQFKLSFFHSISCGINLVRKTRNQRIVVQRDTDKTSFNHRGTEGAEVVNNVKSPDLCASVVKDGGTEQMEMEGGQYHPVERKGDTVTASLVGPDDPFHADSNPLSVRFTVKIHGPDSATLKIGSEKVVLKLNQYSDWIKVDFKAGLGVTVKGICKFLLQSTEPHFQLYVTPVNIDPEKPTLPITHPLVYATYLAKQQGSFATLGLAEDSWALNEKALPDQGFIDQCLQLDDERETMFFDSLDKVSKGLCVCVFDGTDRLQHAFWRDIDPDHPARDESSDGRNEIETLYVRMDGLVARTLEKCNDDKTLFMIISDHGFNTFRYGIDLNRWLEENGYLALKDNDRKGKYLTAIDWPKTRAFALGLTGIFLNIKGRESQGIVEDGEEADRLRTEIAEKLEALVDIERNNAPAIKAVYNSLKLYDGPYKQNAPDLLVGYYPGYRASWETAVGQVTEQVFHPNTKAWSGDHCIDASFVPGVLFSNRRIESENPRLMDIGPTVLEQFGVDVPKYMDGKPLSVSSYAL